MRSSSRDALRQPISPTRILSVSQFSTWLPSVKTSVALRLDIVSTLIIDYFICITDLHCTSSVTLFALFIDSFPFVMPHIGRARRENGKSGPSTVWWAISHACLSLLHLPIPLRRDWGLGLGPRFCGFPAYQGVRAEVGLPSNS